MPKITWRVFFLFWRSLFYRVFSGKFGRIRAKILRTPKNLLAPATYVYVSMMLQSSRSGSVALSALDLIAHLERTGLVVNTSGVGGGVQGMLAHSQKFWFGENSGKISMNSGTKVSTFCNNIIQMIAWFCVYLNLFRVRYNRGRAAYANEGDGVTRCASSFCWQTRSLRRSSQAFCYWLFSVTSREKK